MGVLLGFPIYSDASVLYTPTFASGGWQTANPLTNLADRRLAAVARSISAALADTRLTVDLQTARNVGVIAIPKHTLSSAGKVRVLGRPDTTGLLFDYEAGEDPTALGMVFSRPSGQQSYIDSAGILRYAGENLELWSEDFTNAAWTKTNVTVAANAGTSPDNATNMTAVKETAAGTVRYAVEQAGISATSGLPVTVSRTVQLGARRYVQLDLGATRFAASASAYFDLQLGVVVSTGAGLVSATITPDVRLAGLYRVSVTAIATSSGTFTAVLNASANGTTNTVTGVLNQIAFYVWGAQSQAGTQTTRYLKTTSATVAQLRDAHFMSGARHVLLEPATTNRVVQSEDFSTTWTVIGTPTRVARAHVLSGVALDLIGDDDATTAEGYTQTVPLGVDGVQAVSLFVRQGTASTSCVRFRDTTATTNLITAAITWASGAPVVAMSVGTYLGAIPLTDGVYRLVFLSTAATAANTNVLQVYPASNGALRVTDVGTLYAGGVQLENTGPTSYVPSLATAATRGLDTCSLPLPAVLTTPVALTAYLNMTELGGAQITSGLLYAISEAGNTKNSLNVNKNGGGPYISTVRDGTGTIIGSSAAAVLPGFGVQTELRTLLTTTATIQQGQSLAGAAEVVAAASTSFTFPTQWGGGGSVSLWLGSRNGTNAGVLALRSLRIAAGGAQTLAQMQASVYDSGWVAGYPAGFTAEDLDGINYAAVIVPATAQSFRYWSVQLDDALNAAGYVDLARLVIAQGIRPTVNMEYGGKLGLQTDTARTVTDGGAALYDKKPVRRVTQVSLSDSYETETMTNAWKMLRRAGLDAQVFFVWDTADPFMWERAYLAVMKEASLLEFPYYNAANVPLSLIEEL